MINIVLFGPPGSGKGTQAEKLADKFQFIHCSTGDLFRNNIKNATALGLEAKSYIDKGELVPDEVTNNMLKDFVRNNSDAKGFIFDGYPRTVQQANVLDHFLINEFNSKIDLVLSLIVTDEILVDRLLERGKSSGRTDDANETIIKNRIKEYYEKTDPVSDFYKLQNKWIEIEGVGSIDNITNSLSLKIEFLLQ